MANQKTEEIQMADASSSKGPAISKRKKHRKDKPWDSEDINHWKIEPFQEGDMRSRLLEESSFATLFPKYRLVCIFAVPR